MGLSVVSWSVIAAYSLALVILGILASRRAAAVDYFLASRGARWRH